MGKPASMHHPRGHLPLNELALVSQLLRQHKQRFLGWKPLFEHRHWCHEVEKASKWQLSQVLRALTTKHSGAYVPRKGPFLFINALMVYFISLYSCFFLLHNLIYPVEIGDEQNSYASKSPTVRYPCLLYTSDAADEE